MGISFNKIENGGAPPENISNTELNGDPPINDVPLTTAELVYYKELAGSNSGTPPVSLFSETPIGQLEAKYGLKIEFAEDMPPLSPDEIKILDNTLSRLKQARPADIEKIETIKFYPEEKRLGAAMSGTNIGIVGAFGIKKTADEFEGYDISEDSRWLYQEADTESFLFHVITHETGHMVESNERPDFYENPWCERFAEDYRIYVTSGGKTVVKKDLSGKDVPFYDERLEFFKKSYPISTL